MTGRIVKPLFGQPCNACGLCCILEQCSLSFAIFGAQPLCPALESVEGGAFTCGLIRDPDHYGVGAGRPAVASEAFAVILGAGLGCDGVLTDADRAVAGTSIPDSVIAKQGLEAYRRASVEARELINRLAPRRDGVRA